MSTRKTIVFKINNEVVCEEPKDLTIEEIYQYKECIANEFGCDPYEIEVNLKDECIEDSELDSTPDGLVFWKSTFFTPIVGVECELEMYSDEYFDAVADGTLEKYLKFSIEKFVYSK